MSRQRAVTQPAQLYGVEEAARIKELQQAFDYFDTDGNGSLDKTELQAALRRLGLVGSTGEAEIKALMTEADANNDGSIDFSEFAAIMAGRATPLATTPSEFEDLLKKGSFADREKAYSAIEAEVRTASSATEGGWLAFSRRAATVALASACVGPLMREVLRADASKVAAAEYQRASLVLANMVGLDPVQIGSAYVRLAMQEEVEYAPTSAFGQVSSKPPQALTKSDVLLFAAKVAPSLVAWSVGWSAGGQRLGAWPDDAAAFGPWCQNQYLVHTNGLGRDTSLERNARLTTLALQILQHEVDGLPILVQAGLWLILECGCAGFSDSSQELLRNGLLRTAAAALDQGSPAEWVNRLTGERRYLYGPIWGAIKEVVEAAQNGGVDQTEQLLESGILDKMIGVLKAYEMLGHKSESANFFTLGLAGWLFFVLDTSRSPRIQKAVRANAASFRYVLCDVHENGTGHEFAWVKGSLGELTSATFLTPVLAAVFGRDEQEAVSSNGPIFTPTSWSC